MPYGCLDDATLSEASRKALEKAVERWNASMQVSKPRTFLVLAGYDDGPTEIELRRAVLAPLLRGAEDDDHVILIAARNDEELANKIARHKSFAPIQTLIVFAEGRHALSLRPIFKRKFGKTLELKKFRAEFEFNHPWISTASSFAWLCRNLLYRLWFETKKRFGRKVRKRLKYLFWS